MRPEFGSPVPYDVMEYIYELEEEIVKLEEELSLEQEMGVDYDSD